MPSIITSAAILATAGLAVAAPAKSQGHTFQAKQVETGKYLKSGPIAMVNAISKFGHTGMTASPALKAAAAKDQQGSVSATPENPNFDIAYTCRTTVGNSQLNLDFDTGSSDLWVFATDTPRTQSRGHNLYSPSSSGRKLSGYSWAIHYGDQSGASGTVYSDKVVVGGVTATSQAVEAATSVSSSFSSNTNQDGLLGLGFSDGRNGNTVSPRRQTTFFETVGPTLAKNLFTVDLKKGSAGTYDFGYIDSSKYSGDINYVNINGGNGYWEFQADSYYVGQDSYGTIGDSIMDTGTSLMLLGGNAASDYYSQVPSANYDSQHGIYHFDCSENLPDFSVDIGGVTYTVPGSYINYANDGSAGCFGGIQPAGSLSIFGDVFMKNFFVVFDKSTGSPRMGIASQS